MRARSTPFQAVIGNLAKGIAEKESEDGEAEVYESSEA